MTVYGCWQGGSCYSNDEPEEHLERFASIEAAKDALRGRLQGGYLSQLFDFVNQRPMTVRCPNVGSDSKILLYLALDCDETGRVLLHTNGPDMVVRFGPRGGVVAERQS